MAENTPSSVVKQNFITALRQTPAGIAGFLTAAIPTPPPCSVPTDVDAAIIANGVCAAYVLDLFRPFAGVTPVELLLRIGQHNSVLESALLAGMEYLAETDAVKDFAVIEPAKNGVFLPGDVRLQAKVKTGTLQQVAVECGERVAAMEYDRENNVFWGYLRLEDLGPATLTFTGLFSDDTTVTVDVAITISETPEEEPADPEESDWWPVEMAKEAFDQVYTYVTKGGLLGLVAGKVAAEITESDMARAKTLMEQAATAAAKVKLAAKKAVTGLATSALDTALDAIAMLLGRSREMGDPVTVAVSLNEMLAALGTLKSATDSTYSIGYQMYMKLNPHPSSGYTSCPGVLKGAKAAMLEKYGEGTVIEW